MTTAYQAWTVFCWRCQARHEPGLAVNDACGSDALFWRPAEEFAAESARVCPRCGGREVSARWVVQMVDDAPPGGVP